MSYETRKYRWHRVGEDGHRFKGVRPLSGWVARIKFAQRLFRTT